MDLWTVVGFGVVEVLVTVAAFWTGKVEGLKDAERVRKGIWG